MTETDSRPIYIHYGSETFDTNRFEEATTEYLKNGPWIKPIGGLWASRQNSPNGWNVWTMANHMSYEYKIFDSFMFKLKTNAKIFYIENMNDLQKLEELGVYKKHGRLYGDINPFLYGIDINPLVEKGYDGLELFINGELYWALYGLDCDSIVLFNSDCIELIDRQGENHVQQRDVCRI